MTITDPDSKVLNMRITRILIRYTLYMIFNRENGLSFEIDVFQELKTHEPNGLVTFFFNLYQF